MATIIDGKKVSSDIKAECKNRADALKEKGIEPALAVILVGDNPASRVYVRNKKKACEEAGIRSISYELPGDTREEDLIELIKKLNDDEKVHGILVQLPLPVGIDEDRVLMAISPDKDVDGFHPVSVGNLSIGRPGFVSCTPAGIIELMRRYDIEMSRKRCVIIGRSNIVGKPMALLMLRENATVTITHSKTKDLPAVCREADILIVAIGKAKYVDSSFVKEGAVVIDVGMDRDENDKLCGDVDFESVSKVAGYITPVPGGVGPMTIAMLLNNTLNSAENCI
ncbi:MAG: bifunctional methylenetetrahydrofolate dehydrogenase/methenyltetrahydrofolate cyclohydrolase FolD [Lachnospiraceae bacterium]|nr:bifunctional methylenetetrahydrofolate dehydrogenase/methenyltetrahydrofolate cyclohydrolase FolD [Lachnospiraceae bacterium]